MINTEYNRHVGGGGQLLAKSLYDHTPAYCVQKKIVVTQNLILELADSCSGIAADEMC